MLVAIFSLVGCSERSRLHGAIAKIEISKLVSTAEEFWIKQDDKNENSSNQISETNWTPEIYNFKPKRVYSTPDGVYLAVTRASVYESGLFILPVKSKFIPKSGGDPSYEHLQDNLYWYEIRG